mgnify:FL=1
MSKKNLLNEATVRRFMKLADLGPLAEEFLPETEEDVTEEVVEEEKATDEVVEEEVKEEVESEAVTEEVAEEVAEEVVEEEAVEEMYHAPAKHDDDHEEEAPEADMVSLGDLKKGLEALVAAVPGLDLEVEGEEEEAEVEIEVPAEDPIEDLEDEEPAMGHEDPAMAHEKLEEEESLAEQITKRVMQKLAEAEESTNKEIDIDVLAERIVERLSEKK